VSIPRTSVVVRLAAVAAAVVLALPVAASAASYEQVSRTSGAYSTATSLPGEMPATGVGDVGRFVSFGPYVRDVQNNLTTRPGGAATVLTYGLDRLETKVLIARSFADRVELAVTPLTGGGQSKVLYTVPGISLVYNALAYVSMSVDGSTVDFCDQQTGQSKSVDTVTGAITLLAQGSGAYHCDTITGRGPTSWDRRTRIVPTQTTDGSYQYTVRRDGAPIYWFAHAVFPRLSGDGSTLVYGVDPIGLGQRPIVVVRLATHTATRFTLPTKYVGTDDLWISPTGDRIVPLQAAGAKSEQMDTTTGAWSTFGGPYAGSARLLAPSGRFALLTAGYETVLADLTGADIPGASDPLSADVYTTSTYTYICGRILGLRWPPYNNGSIGVTLVAKPTPWAPALQKADVTVKLGASRTLQTVTGALPGTTVGGSFTGDYTQWSATVTTTDVDGRVARETITRPMGCSWYS
jgi:hypothetical protein